MPASLASMKASCDVHEMQGDLFRPASVENQARRLQGDVVLQSSFSTRLMTGAVLAVVALAIACVLFAHYARTEPAKGILVPVNGASKIYAMHPGVVSAFVVKDGDVVRAGQKLALVTLETPNAAGSFGTAEALDSLRAQRLLADEQLDLSRERSATDSARLDAVADGLRAQEVTIKEQIGLQREMVISATATFDQLRGIVEKGFVSKLEYERRRQVALAARQELSRLNQQLSSIKADIAKTSRERSRALLDGQTEQATTRSAIQALRQQRARFEGESSYLIKAPVSGRVTAIQTSIGQTVGNSVPMLVIIPEGSRLRADIYVPTRAIGFIKPGQEVKLMYDAFPYQRFGSFSARIETISRVAIAGAETNAPFKIEEPVYRITVIPKSQQVPAYGGSIPLQPGMTLVANIVLERQTFLEWFLSPLRAVANRS